MTFGDLVHQTIDDIHKAELDGKLGEITNEHIRENWLNNNYTTLISRNNKSLSEHDLLLVLEQVLSYFNQKYTSDHLVLDSEMDISMETPLYIIQGRVDLLIKENNLIKIIDFKTQSRASNENYLQNGYYDQLYIYAYVLREKYGINPQGLYIYWTRESERDSALMELPMSENKIINSNNFYDNIARSILERDFAIKNKPQEHTCMECDFKYYCSGQGTISYKPLNKILSVV
jgi:DNA helicase-2/ATP-dependent DNA helicase PcrA